MEHETNPMCQVPLSYLLMLQGRGASGSAQTESVADSQELKGELARVTVERDGYANQIAEFEFRAGCKLEHIPVEALGQAQNAYVSQQAIDTLKASNARLEQDYNRAVSEMTDWRGRYKELEREGKGAAASPAKRHAPHGVKKDGSPRKRPGPPPRKRAA